MRIRAGASIGRKVVRKANASWPSERRDMSNIRAQFREVVIQPLQEIFDGLEEASADICMAALEPTFEKSQVYVPKDTGDLADSGYLEVVKTSKGPVVEIGYGRAGSPSYAVAVHERTDIQHQEPTRAKFLEAAVTEDLGEIRDRVYAGYRKVWNG
jgi:hypothetical protein